MAYLSGVTLGLGIGMLTSLVGMDRDRALYPAILIVIASYYVLFAFIGGAAALVSELLIAIAFLIVAIIAFRTNLWIVVIAVVGHGVQDMFHSLFIVNPGVPTWWPMFCASIDVAIGMFLAWRLVTKGIETGYGAPRYG